MTVARHTIYSCVWMAKAIDEFTITLSQMWQLFTICASTLLSIGDKYRMTLFSYECMQIHSYVKI